MGLPSLRISLGIWNQQVLCEKFREIAEKQQQLKEISPCSSLRWEVVAGFPLIHYGGESSGK